jgi:flagellin-specific chaperone FliS
LVATMATLLDRLYSSMMGNLVSSNLKRDFGGVARG